MNGDSGPDGPIIVASAGDPFPPEVLAKVADLAGDTRPPVFIVSIARIWGTALGLPNPGLFPTRQEMTEQGARVEAARTALVQRGFPVQTTVIRARKASKAIVRYAETCGCRVLVIAAPACSRWQRIFFGDVPSEIKRRTTIQVEAVTVPVR